MTSFLLLASGPTFLAVTFLLMYQRVEPFATFFYLFAWYGLIYSFDRAIAHREGRSLIARCGTGFLIMLLWSAAGWFFFEIVNLRLQNWYYIFVPAEPVWRYSNTILAFCTVFPGMFWIDHYLGLRGVCAGWRGKTRTYSPRWRRNVQLLGVLWAVLPMLYPTYFFPLVWGALILLLAPVNYDVDKDSILRQWERGEYGPTARMLLAGLIAGLFWECFNFWARAKWVYTVPFFDELKLFEMPVAGFIGFPPFAVECAIFYRILVWHRLAPVCGSFDARKPLRNRPGSVAAIALAAVVMSATTHYYMDRMTVASVTPRVADLKTGDAATLARLQALDIHHLTALEGRRGLGLWQALSTSLDQGRLERLRQLTELYLHMGIGIEQGGRLVRAGIPSVEALGRLSAEQVRDRLEELDDTPPPPLARIKVWVRRAR